MKKVILSLALAFISILSSVMLFACGSDPLNPCAEIGELVTEIQGDASSSQYVGDITSTYYADYILDSNFKGYKIRQLVKRGDGSTYTEWDDDLCNGIFALSFDKIREYYFNLLDVKSDKLQGVRDALSSFKKEYKEFNELNKSMLSISSNAEDEIHNGFYARFKQGVVEYIDSTYSLASEILLALKTNYTATDVDEQVVLRKYYQICYDYEVIKALGDIKDLFFDSCKADYLNGNSVLTTLTNPIKNIATYDCKATYNISATDLEKFEELSKVFDGERALFQKAIKNFSIYDYVKGESTLADYCKENNSEQDYDKIEEYLSSNGYLIQYFTTINKF